MFTNSGGANSVGNITLPVAGDGEDDAHTTEIEDALAAYVREQFNDSLFHRRRLGLDDKLLQCMRSMRTQYTPEEMALFESVDIYPGLSSLKARAGEAWINDILINSSDKPWTLAPTPLPDLPQWMKDNIVEQLQQEVQQLGIVDINQIKNRARDLKDASYQDAQDMAQHACDNMEHLIEDQLLEGGWRKVFGQFVADLMVFPVALVRAPTVHNECQLSWQGNKVVVVDKPIIAERRIDPFDAFPSPDSSDTQDGHYFIERNRITPERLYGGIGIPGFSEDAIRFVLERYKDGYIERTTEDAERRRLEDRETPLLETRTLDTLIYNGKVKGKLLVEHGVLVNDLQKWYEVEVWTIGNYVVRAVLNPDPTGARPVHGTSYKKNNGSFWGESVISLLFDIERCFNSFIRAALKNAQFSAGPIGEVDTARIGDDDKPTEFTPYRLYHTTPDMSGMGGDNRAFHFHQVANNVQWLLEHGANYFYKLADDISGIPSYVMGNPQVQGGARTLGGLSMLMGNAAKGIKAVALNIDKDVIEPMVDSYYKYNMLTSDDPDIKADIKVIARGASGLLQRELAQSKMTDLLQLLTPYATTPVQGNTVLPPEAIQQLIREVVKSTGIDIQKFLPDQQQEQSNQAQDLNGVGIQAAFQRGISNPQPLPAQSQPQISNKPSPINLPQGA